MRKQIGSLDLALNASLRNSLFDFCAGFMTASLEEGIDINVVTFSVMASLVDVALDVQGLHDGHIALPLEGDVLTGIVSLRLPESQQRVGEMMVRFRKAGVQ